MLQSCLTYETTVRIQNEYADINHDFQSTNLHAILRIYIHFVRLDREIFLYMDLGKIERRSSR